MYPTKTQARIGALLKALPAAQKRACALKAGTSLPYLYRLSTQVPAPNPTARVVAALTAFCRDADIEPITAEDFANEL